MIKNKHTLNYRIVGEGYPVVFLHGFLESNTMWENIVKDLPKVQAICIELPGHGESPLPKDELSLPFISRMVTDIVQSLSFNQFSVVGHSLGGYVALHLAEDPALKIDQVVLLHSHPWADSESKKIDRNRITKIIDYDKMLFLKEAIPSLFYQPEKHETQINHLLDSAYAMETRAINQTLFAMRDREDKKIVLTNLGNRVHVIHGEFDHLIDAKSMKEITKMTKSNYHLIKGIGHMGHEEAREKVISLLISSLEKRNYR